ncbi:right-handed parallel beta-helix repeat-containing protein [Planococcus sp. X10-3]|uniref:right-handed parallel beta-helix repeat-containing protein n=1 Tax=Planococcus sp. X10-3 TaxID=3061240 RepID=UPI003BB0FB5A
METNNTYLELIEGGSVFKQGDRVDLAFRPFNYKGEVVSLAGKTISTTIRKAGKGILFEGIASWDFEKQAIVQRTPENLEDGVVVIEFLVTDPNDPEYKTIFPSSESNGRLKVTPSSENIDYVGVKMTTVSQLKAEQKADQDAFEAAVIPRVESVESKTETSLINLVKNGDFRNGVTGWASGNGLLSVADNALVIASRGTNQNPQANYNITSLGVSNYYTKLKFRLTDPDAVTTKVSVLQGSVRKDITDFTIGEWYSFEEVFTNIDFTRISLLWETPSALAGANTVLEVKEVLSIDLNKVVTGGVSGDKLKSLLEEMGSEWFYRSASIGKLQRVLMNNYLKPSFVNVLNYISVKDYGAIGNGIADDTAALQEAFDVKRNVYIPPGNYKITGTLYVHSDTNVYGDGESSHVFLGDGYVLDTIVWRAASDWLACPYIVTMPESKNITVKNFKISGNTSQIEDLTHFGLAFADTTNGIAENMIIQYVNYEDSLSEVWLRGFNIVTMRASDIQIKGGNFDYGGYECVCINDGSENITVDGANIGIGWRTSIQVHRRCKDIKIINNTIVQNAPIAHGAVTFHAEPGEEIVNVLFANNFVDATVGVGQRALQTHGFGSEENLIITGNTIKSNQDGLYLKAINGAIVSNNIVIAGRFSIHDLAGSRNTLITGNKLLSVKGLNISRDVQNLKILHNEITNSEDSGIKFGENSKNILIAHNDIHSFYYGIYENDFAVENLQIFDNTIVSETNNGIVLNYTGVLENLGWRVSGNTVSVPDTMTAIFLNANINYAMVNQNTVLAGGIGVRLHAGASNSLVAFNNVANSAMGVALTGTGTGNITRDNLE